MDSQNNSPLSPELIEQLMRDPSPDTRANAASQVAQSYDNDLSIRERAIAEDIFHAMVKDAEAKVRAALSEGLKSSPNIPSEIAVKLAQDIDPTVAIPILEFSSLLSDDDLVQIIASRPSSHQEAIARRARISENVSDNLVEFGNEKVVATLLNNHGAQISVNTFGRVLENFGQDAIIQGRMVDRHTLPIVIAEKLVALVSDELRHKLVTQHDLSDGIATDLVAEAREKATMNLLDDGATKPDIFRLVSQLHGNGRLTPSIIIRAACLGDMDFLEAALAERCNIPVANAYKLIHDRGELGLKNIIEKAGLPAECYPVLKVAVSVSAENDYDGRTRDREHFVESSIERVLTSFEDDVDSENLEYLLNRLQKYSGAES